MRVLTQLPDRSNHLTLTRTTTTIQTTTTLQASISQQRQDLVMSRPSTTNTPQAPTPEEVLSLIVIVSLWVEKRHETHPGFVLSSIAASSDLLTPEEKREAYEDFSTFYNAYLQNRRR